MPPSPVSSNHANLLVIGIDDAHGALFLLLTDGIVRAVDPLVPFGVLGPVQSTLPLVLGSFGQLMVELAAVCATSLDVRVAPGLRSVTKNCRLSLDLGRPHHRGFRFSLGRLDVGR